MTKRSLVLVSGYYGFDNLGDEAILEELITELKNFVKADEIVVLSASPESTSRRFGVRALARNSYAEFFALLAQTRLFVSGGGGLFQNTKTIGSILFYGLQLLMARANNCKVFIYAQGIGPLRGRLAENICKEVFARADEIAVRDDASMTYLKNWGLKGTRSADPVWMLQESAPPVETLDLLEKLNAKKGNSRCVGLSLRPSPLLTEDHISALVEGLYKMLREDESILFLPLQADQDKAVLEKFESLWLAKGRRAYWLNPEQLSLPSQWIAVFSRLKLLVGMRLHALIMALKSEIPVIGIAYDPKVTQLLTEFEQNCLILTKEDGGNSWAEDLETMMDGLDSATSRAEQHLKAAKNLACQNFQILDRILSMPRES